MMSKCPSCQQPNCQRPSRQSRPTANGSTQAVPRHYPLTYAAAHLRHSLCLNLRITADQAYKAALDIDLISAEDSRFISRIGGLKRDRRTLFAQAL